jgi:hypothetical protein
MAINNKSPHAAGSYYYHLIRLISGILGQNSFRSINVPLGNWEDKFWTVPRITACCQMKSFEIMYP